MREIARYALSFLHSVPRGSLFFVEKGATVTFLLRYPAIFDNDAIIKPFVQSGHARIVQGDALKPEDVARAWASAQEGPGSLDLVLYTLGKCAPLPPRDIR